MGISPGLLAFFSDLCRTRALRPGDAILDIGASELFCADEPQSLNDLLAAAGAAPLSDAELARMANRAFAGEFFRRAGFGYQAIDRDEYPDVIRLDLNSDALPIEHRSRYRLVTNSGTSEHILNQWNVFKVIHEAVALDGLMYHGVPGWGDYQHGIFQYAPKFFWALAKANGYDLLRFWGWADGQPAAIAPEILAGIQFTSAPVSERVWLHVLMRKSLDQPFAGLTDPAFDFDSGAPRGVLRLWPNPHSLTRRIGRKLRRRFRSI
jgi:hypothetical protein